MVKLTEAAKSKSALSKGKKKDLRPTSLAKSNSPKRKKLAKGVLGTVVIGEVEVQILKPAGKGTIPAADIRKAVAAVRKAQKEKDLGKSGE